MKLIVQIVLNYFNVILISIGAMELLAYLYKLISVNQSWITITTWHTVKRKAVICRD